MLKRLLKIITLSALIATVCLPGLPVRADGASIYLTSSRSLVSAGNNLIVAVYMNGGGTPVNAVAANLYYPASQLQYVGLSYTGSAFSINTPSNGGGGGSVSIQNGTISPVSGSGLVATVTFKVLASSGSAVIGVSSSSSLINANDNSSVPFSASGVSVSFGSSIAPAAAAPANSNAAAAAATPAPVKDTTPPVISDISAIDLTPFSATISWKTNEPADSSVDYGLNSSYGLSASLSQLTTNHQVVLNSDFLLPELQFHFRVNSTDGSGNIASSPDQTFILPGIPVTIVVVGANGKPQAGANVTIDGNSGTTNSTGRVTLQSGIGTKKITTNYLGVSAQKSITVSSSAKPLPPVQLDLASRPLNHWMLVAIGLIVIVMLLLVIDAMLFGSRILARLTGLKFMHHPALSVANTAVSTTEASLSPLEESYVDEAPVVNINDSPAAPIVNSEPLSEPSELRPEEPISEPETQDDIEPEATQPTVNADRLTSHSEPASRRSLPSAPLIAPDEVDDQPRASQATDVASRLKRQSAKKTNTHKPKPGHSTKINVTEL